MIITIGSIAATIGFLISLYIGHSKRTQKPMMCPRKAPCETVISSPQAKTFGIRNTVLGTLYYIVTFFLFLCLYIGGPSRPAAIFLFVLTLSGFVFSLYLVRVQKVIIKQWCVWCLGSAAMATIIFICAFLILL
jgi:uncharacterized membrane protein